MTQLLNQWIQENSARNSQQWVPVLIWHNQENHPVVMWELPEPCQKKQSGVRDLRPTDPYSGVVFVAGFTGDG